MAANQDIFNRNISKLGGVFAADKAVLVMPEGLSVLAQQLGVTYAQTITRLYELGSDFMYYVGGRTQGSMNMASVVGPKGTVKAFYTKYGDVCSPDSIALKLRDTNCLAGTPSVSLVYTMRNAVIQQVGMSVTAQDMIINENSQMMYASLELDENN